MRVGVEEEEVGVHVACEGWGWKEEVGVGVRVRVEEEEVGVGVACECWGTGRRGGCGCGL